MVEKASKVVVRFAPSPTGIPHLGNIRTAFFNYLFARKNKGKFILRLEDTDRARFVKEAEEAIFESLKWLKLDFDEKYVQSERLSVYKEYADQLLKEKRVFEKEGAVYFRMPKEGVTEWVDEVGKKKIKFENKTQEDFVILKSDGYPTYNFANVIDDHLMGVTHVIRGEEFISSTPKHISLYKALDWDLPHFAHMPIILGPDKSKLSKRHGAKSVIEYKNEGYLREGLLNYIALLGWNPGGDKEVFSIEEIVKLFDLKDINTSNPVFDFQKLDWINATHLRSAREEVLEKELLDFDPKLKKFNKKDLQKLLEVAKTRMVKLADFEPLVSPYFLKEKVKLSSNQITVACLIHEELEKLKQWDEINILEVLKSVCKKQNIKMSEIYVIATGKKEGLPLPQVFSVIGKEKTLNLFKVRNV